MLQSQFVITQDTFIEGSGIRFLYIFEKFRFGLAFQGELSSMLKLIEHINIFGLAFQGEDSMDFVQNPNATTFYKCTLDFSRMSLFAIGHHCPCTVPTQR